ncbi:hypothetical protein ANAPH2_01270 [Anaplasma phagocytophilum]|nr:hypothetical protein ANAPH2_01270 [Anaplasma phagocytophilum]
MSRGSKEELELNECISKWYKDNIRALVIISATYLALFLIIFFCILFSDVSYMPMDVQYTRAETVLTCLMVGSAPIITGLIIVGILLSCGINVGLSDVLSAAYRYDRAHGFCCSNPYYGNQTRFDFGESALLSRIRVEWECAPRSICDEYIGFTPVSPCFRSIYC